jgi:hypothetical protein
LELLLREAGRRKGPVFRAFHRREGGDISGKSTANNASAVGHVVADPGRGVSAPKELAVLLIEGNAGYFERIPEEAWPVNNAGERNAA